MGNDANNNEHSIVRFNLLTSLLSLLNQNGENDTDFVIAKYFLLNLKELKSISIYKIAEDCYVSRSSVQRFIKNIGYDSFTQMKSSIDEIIVHEEGFASYTDRSDYRNYISQAISAMIEDIRTASETPAFSRLLNIFMKAKNVVILSAEDSSHACRLFQQQILTTGKLLRIITSANKNIDLLSTLEKDDLLLVCSVTGNYAVVINDQIRDVRAKKCLITLNHTSLFEDSYSFIYYLGKQMQFSTQNIVSSRNVYNNYGLTFFFDLFYHECYSLYRRQK